VINLLGKLKYWVFLFITNIDVILYSDLIHGLRSSCIICFNLLSQRVDKHFQFFKFAKS
jgi:hypothetical protein